MDTTFEQAAHDGRVSGCVGALAQRAAFEAFFALWLPRVHRFARARLAVREAAEAATRRALEAAVRAGAVGARGDVAPLVLALAKAAIARQRAATAA
ncbi:MAG: hypothetical protein ACHQ6V_12900 [Myxococcota bacterium]